MQSSHLVKRQRFEREAATWSRLDFVYLLHFIGIYYMSGTMCLVSPFVENGSLPKYLKRHPDANRRRLVGSTLRLKSSLTYERVGFQLFETALAIAYLHKCELIHGDIKGENILVSREHTVLLSDFGLSRPQGDPTSVGQRGMGTIPWQSPEVLMGASKSFESDMYAFGMTIYEVWARSLPSLRMSSR